MALSGAVRTSGGLRYFKEIKGRRRLLACSDKYTAGSRENMAILDQLSLEHVQSHKPLSQKAFWISVPWRVPERICHFYIVIFGPMSEKNKKFSRRVGV
jgi:hypothetical protein